MFISVGPPLLWADSPFVMSRTDAQNGLDMVFNPNPNPNSNPNPNLNPNHKSLKIVTPLKTWLIWQGLIKPKVRLLCVSILCHCIQFLAKCNHFTRANLIFTYARIRIKSYTTNVKRFQNFIYLKFSYIIQFHMKMYIYEKINML
jgi:hypothetical protein